MDVGSFDTASPADKLRAVVLAGLVVRIMHGMLPPSVSCIPEPLQDWMNRRGRVIGGGE